MAKHLVPDLGIQSACYPDTVRGTLVLRSGFPPDYVGVANPRDTQLDQPRESLLDSQDGGPPTILHLDKPLPIEPPPIHHESPLQHTIYQDPNDPRPTHESPPQHISHQGPDGLRPAHESPHQHISHQGPNGPNPPRESCSTNVPRCRNELSGDEIPQPQYHTFAHIVYDPREPSIMPRGHSEDGPSNRHNNPQAISLQNMLVKQNAELREFREVTQENRRRIENLHSEIAHRDIQIRALKHTISKVRTSNTALATDSQIESDYNYFTAQLKNWTLSHFRGCKPTHTSQTLANFGLTDPNTVASAAKLLAESTPRRFQVVSMLVMLYLDRHVFSAFLFGADNQEQQLLKSLSNSFIETATVREIHFWRSDTLKMVVATEHHKRSVCERKKEIVAKIESLLVDTVPAGGNAGKRADSLKIVVDQAVALALMLRVQRAEYFLYRQGPGKKFQENFMQLEDDDSEDEGREEGGSGSRLMGLLKGKSQKKIGLTVFPALVKSGNDEGENYKQSECLCKAKVLRG